MFRVFLFLILGSLLFSKGYEPFLSFSASKSALIKIYSQHKILPLSGCPYDFDPKGCSLAGIVDFKSCHYEIRSDALQAAQVDWMHVMDPHDFGSTLSCLTQKECLSAQSGKAFKGVRCCKQKDPKFKRMYTDMHNIIPVIGEHKNIRENKPYLPAVNHNALEPGDDAKGMVARAYLYMIDTYDLEVDKRFKEIWLQWHRKYPPSQWERYKNGEIFKVQGTFNPYIEQIHK